MVLKSSLPDVPIEKLNLTELQKELEKVKQDQKNEIDSILNVATNEEILAILDCPKAREKLLATLRENNLLTTFENTEESTKSRNQSDVGSFVNPNRMNIVKSKKSKRGKIELNKFKTTSAPNVHNKLQDKQIIGKINESTAQPQTTTSRRRQTIPEIKLIKEIDDLTKRIRRGINANDKKKKRKYRAGSYSYNSRYDSKEVQMIRKILKFDLDNPRFRPIKMKTAEKSSNSKRSFSLPRNVFQKSYHNSYTIKSLHSKSMNEKMSNTRIVNVNVKYDDGYGLNLNNEKHKDR